MEKRVIDLEIIDDLEGSGVDAIALVDSPAIEKNFMYFRAEQFVDPQAGESKSDYMGRCISNNMDEGQSQEQAVAVCISKWEAHSAMEFAKVSFDYDDTLSTNAGLALAMRYRRNGDTLYIISAAPAISTEMMDRAFKLDIPRDRVFATGSNLAKVAKVRELKIAKHIDNNADVVRSLSGIAQKFEINTGGLAPYTDQTGPLEKKAVLAAVDDLSVGDEVSWKTADQNPRGRITEIVKGAKKVPGVDFEIQGTEEDPGYIIEIYEEVDGKWEPTGKYVGRKADSILKNVQLAAVHNYSKMMFADEDKKEIVAIAMVPDMQIPRKDKDGNLYFVRFSKAVIAKIAEKYMREQRLSDTNIQHVDSADAGAYVFESWIVETVDDKANSVYGLGAPVGAWCVKMRVTNLETWAKVKSGELKGLSIQGDFLDKNEYEAYMKDKKMYDELVKLVSTF